MNAHTDPSSSPDYDPIKLRPAQEAVYAYAGGPMGVTAVPGSGKTFVLSLVAARLVVELAEGQAAEDQAPEDQVAGDQAGVPSRVSPGGLPRASQRTADDPEVLVVTMTNSAVENFRERIAGFLTRERSLIPGVGYRVRTLHGLANDIVRERPGLVGLSDDFDILDEKTTDDIKSESVREVFRRLPDTFAAFVRPENQRDLVESNQRIFNDIGDVATTVIRVAKQARMTANELQARREDLRGHWPLLDFGVSAYVEYQRALDKRGAVDFEDLIVLALRAMDADPDWLARLQARWPWVLEDEAQDSSLLQEEMLRRLTRKSGNWVRVGDPNQAISTTFTGADMRFLRRFIADHPEGARELPNSGRSSLEIINLANQLIRWSQSDPILRAHDLALADPLIEPTPEGDPKPNPEGIRVYLWDKALSPEEEIGSVCGSLEKWIKEHPDKSAAVLAPDNNHVFNAMTELLKRKVPVDDSLLRTSSGTRAGAKALATVLEYLAHPTRAEKASNVWAEVWWPLVGQPLSQQRTDAGPQPDDAPQPDDEPQPASRVVAVNLANMPAPVSQFRDTLRRLSNLEQFVFPIDSDWLDQKLADDDPLRFLVERFRSDLQYWTRATVLPIDELVLLVGNAIFTDPSDLALAHRLALHLDKLARENPAMRLGGLAGELRQIAENRRKFATLADEGEGYREKPGVVTLSTIHKAKGLEWDRVHVMAVNTFDFPSASPDTRYRGDRYWVRDGLNLTAEVEAQVNALMEGSLDAYVQGAASEMARIESAAEKLRLLYVGITRARTELILTYNTGRPPNRQGMAEAMKALLNPSTG